MSGPKDSIVVEVCDTRVVVGYQGRVRGNKSLTPSQADKLAERIAKAAAKVRTILRPAKDEETACPKRKDETHCVHWYDGLEPCCACGDNTNPQTPEEQGWSPYERARFVGVLRTDRWEKGTPHHPKALDLMEFLKEIDFEIFNDHFSWKTGGDGNNGETLMYQMDAYFELHDLEAKKHGDKEKR